MKDCNCAERSSLLPGLYIRTEKYSDAVGILLRFAAACDTTGAHVSQCKAYLGAVVVWLYANNGEQAWATYQASLVTVLQYLFGTLCTPLCPQTEVAVFFYQGRVWW